MNQFETICNQIQARRKLSEGSMIKYRHKLLKFHKRLMGDAPFENLEFLHEKTPELMEAIKEDKPAVARSSYSCLLGSLTNKDKTAISPAFNDVVQKLRTKMEILNQAYVDTKMTEPHSKSQLENWVSVPRLKKYQRKVMREAMEIYNHVNRSKKQITWNEFKVIQKATIVTLYINYRKSGEKYPTWFKANEKELPDISNESHLAPKRLEYGDMAVARKEDYDKARNTLVVSGALSRHKKLWFAEQKNTDTHYEPVNNMLNKALNVQLWAVENYTVEKTDKLLIMKNETRMNKANLSSWIGMAFESLGVEMTANTLRHIVAEETGVGTEQKKLLNEQLLLMNHSNQVHDLAYST